MKTFLILIFATLISGCGKGLEGKYTGMIFSTPITYEFISDKDVYVYVGDGRGKEKLSYKINGNNLEVSSKEKTAVYEIVNSDEIKVEGQSLDKSTRYKMYQCETLKEAQVCSRCEQLDAPFVEYSVSKRGVVTEVFYESDGAIKRRIYGDTQASKCNIENKMNWGCEVSIASGIANMIAKNGMLAIAFADKNQNTVFSCAKPI